MSTLNQKVVIVTGGGAGIGQGIAELAAREGASVILAEINGDQGAATAGAIQAGGGSATFMETDIAEVGSVEAMVKQVLASFGRIDALVNNAGVDLEGETTSFSPETWRKVVDTNLGGAFFCSRACLPSLRDIDGVIVNIASVHAMYGFAGAAAYDASKGGLVALTRSLAVENGPHGVRVNAVCPGYIDTDLWEQDKARQPDPEAYDRLIRENHPLRRRGTARDVAQAVRFLLSDEASWITGTTLVVDGGMGAQFFEQAFDFG